MVCNVYAMSMQCVCNVYVGDLRSILVCRVC